MFRRAKGSDARAEVCTRYGRACIDGDGRSVMGFDLHGAANLGSCATSSSGLTGEGKVPSWPRVSQQLVILCRGWGLSPGETKPARTGEQNTGTYTVQTWPFDVR